MNRRDFLRYTIAGSLAAPRASAALVPGTIRSGQQPAVRNARATTARIDVLPDEPIAMISANLYGHFVEHLGGVVYDGVWVGEGSPIANSGGIRQALVDHMRRLPPGPIRWPGGCFADSYDWRDGIGPRASRPRRTNFWEGEAALAGPGRYDPNHFGTNEFVRFCRLAGGEPYLAANLRSLSPRDLYQWMEYCNSPAGSTTLAEQRAAGGDREPFRVRYWGVGNEAWGCGGNFTPEEYATEYRRFVAWVPRFGQTPSFIGSGPNGGDIGWTRRFLAKLTEKGDGQLGSLWGWALHHYSWNVSRGATTDWNAGKGDALRFSPDEWYELLNEGDRIDTLIADHWAAMGEIDRRRRVKLVVDEWGAWHRSGTEVNPGHVFGQQSTLRDALLAAMTLDTFHRHADKVAMANVAQLVNCLHSLFLADGDRFVPTPTFHVFELYKPHVGGQSVRTVWSAPPIGYARVNADGSLRGVAGSASLHDRALTLTVVNPHISEPLTAEIGVRGRSDGNVTAVTIAEADVHAHNTFDRPEAVRPRAVPAQPMRAGVIVHSFAPASVTRLTVAL